MPSPARGERSGQVPRIAQRLRRRPGARKSFAASRPASRRQRSPPAARAVGLLLDWRGVALALAQLCGGTRHDEIAEALWHS